MQQPISAFFCALAMLFGIVRPTADAVAAEQPAPALRQFVAEVIAEHPAIRRAEAELEAARARARGQARPLYNPEIELGYEDALDDTRQLGLSQTLDWAGKRSARARVAKAEVEGARAALALTRKTVLGELLSALAAYETSRHALDLAERRVRLNRDFLALAEKRNQAGDLSRSELLTAQLSLAEARVTESARRSDFSAAAERVRAVTALVPPRQPLLTADPPPPPPSIEGVAREALPELRLAAADVAAARSAIRLAKRNRIPDPTLGLGVGRQRTGPAFARESTTLVGVSLRIPLFVRNGFSAEVDAAGARWVARERGYDDLERRIEARLAASLDRYREAFEAWGSWARQGTAPLEEQRRLLQRLWRTGEISAVEYIIQLNQTFATESAGVELRGRLWTTWFEWLDAAARIDDWLETMQ